jgi:hypothetical protein
LVSGLSALGSGFNPRQLEVEYVVKVVELENISVRGLQFSLYSINPPMLHILIPFIYHLHNTGLTADNVLYVNTSLSLSEVHDSSRFLPFGKIHQNQLDNSYSDPHPPPPPATVDPERITEKKKHAPYWIRSAITHI